MLFEPGILQAQGGQVSLETRLNHFDIFSWKRLDRTFQDTGRGDGGGPLSSVDLTDRQRHLDLVIRVIQWVGYGRFTPERIRLDTGLLLREGEL